MNRNMMIGGVVAIIVVIVLLVVFVLGGDDEEDNGNGDEGITSEALTSAFEALLEGDAEAAKALTCEDDHANIDDMATAMGAIEDASVESCEVDGDTATCTLTIAGESSPVTLMIEDGLICGGLDATGPGAGDGAEGEDAEDEG